MFTQGKKKKKKRQGLLQILISMGIFFFPLHLEWKKSGNKRQDLFYSCEAKSEVLNQIENDENITKVKK